MSNALEFTLNFKIGHYMKIVSRGKSIDLCKR